MKIKECLPTWKNQVVGGRCGSITGWYGTGAQEQVRIDPSLSGDLLQATKGGTMSNDQQYRVGFPIYDGVTLLDFAGATQIFRFASGFESVWVADSLSSIQTTENVQVLPGATFDEPGEIDILFVPGGGGEGVSSAMFNPRLQTFLKQVANSRVNDPDGEASPPWIGAVCTGAFILAAARLLDGCPATTYWSQLDNLRLLENPHGINVVDGYPRYVVDEQRRRFTGGGVSSSMDLALRLVELLKGTQVAKHAQLTNQYAPDPHVDAGDPSRPGAADIVDEARRRQQGFTATIKAAVSRLLES